MSKSFVSVGVTIVDIVGYPINDLPEGESTELIQKIQICPAGTAAARSNDAVATAAQVPTGVGSNTGVRDFETTLRTMQAGSMNILQEDG